MAEQLGEAVLLLRTDDKQLGPGIAAAEGKAQKLGNTFDKTSSSAAKMSTQLTATGRAAVASGNQFQQSGRGVTTSVGAQAMGMRQLTMQLNDVATMYAMGMRPMQIYTSQIGQVLQSIQMMHGGAKGFVGFLAGPWGMAITMATLLLTPFIGKLLETDRAMELVEEGADAMAQAQSSLGQVFDLVSGKLKTQNELLILNARLLAINMRAEAQAKRASAREGLAGAARPAARTGAASFFEAQTLGVPGLGPTTGEANAAAVMQLLRDVGSGKISRDDALKRSTTMDFAGTQTTRSEFQAALRDAIVANLNDRAADLIDQSLDSGELATELREPGRTKAERSRKDTGPTAEEIKRRFESEEIGLTRDILASRLQLATSAEERAELEWRSVEWARREALADVAANEDYNAEQKAILSAAITRRADAEIEVIEFRKRLQLEQEAQAIAEERHRAEVDALQTQYGLADTDADRKRIALEIFDAEQAYLQSKLEAITLSDTANEHEKERAQLALDALRAQAGARREAVARGNETEVERYLRDINRTPAQISEAIDRVKMDGLDALNEGIVDAITGARTLGEVFHDIAGQIVADLLRIAVQRAITAPLANMLFPGGGGGGPTDLLAGTPYGGSGGGGGDFLGSIGGFFAGLFASGGLIPAGQFGIVGERGPEPVIGTSRGAMVLPNRSLRDASAGGGMTLNQTILIPERTDPRRTASGIARSTQGALARAAGKGLASGPRFSRS